MAGRVEALALLYQSLSEHGVAEEIDLGIYLSQVASAVMRAHGVEGIRLDLKVDTWPVSINVAMPTGLVVNELLTNSFKHGFKDRDGGTITVHSLVDDHGCRVIVADDGVGLPPGMEWPKTRQTQRLDHQFPAPERQGRCHHPVGAGQRGARDDPFLARCRGGGRRRNNRQKATDAPCNSQPRPLSLPASANDSGSAVVYLICSIAKADEIFDTSMRDISFL